MCAENMMRVIQVTDRHAIERYTGMYPIAAPNIEDAIARMKRFKPGLIPHTCKWHTFSEGINQYYFFCEREGEL